MARRQDELVTAIRTQRRELQTTTRELLGLEPLKASIRSHPVPWLIGGAVLGGLLLRFAIKPMWKRRSGWAGNWMRSRLRGSLLRLITATILPNAKKDESTSPAAAVALVPRPGKVARARARITPVRGGSRAEHLELARRRSMR